MQRSRRSLLAAGFVGVLILTVGVMVVASLPRSTPGPRIPPIQASQPAPSRVEPRGATTEPATALGDTVADVYDRAGSAVVNVAVKTDTWGLFPGVLPEGSEGSGFIVDKDGHVATNYHVTRGASRLDVTLASGESYRANVVGVDSANDVAMLRIDAPKDKLQQLPTLPLGDSSDLRVGDFVLAIGNPFGLERSMSLGIVSSLGRIRPGTEDRLISNMIQTDAPINPGNSGGPLLNLDGQVVGIAAQIEAPTPGNVGVGFAIPVDTLKRYLPDLLAGREPQHAWLGISGVALTPSLADQLDATARGGVLITRVARDGPAAKAGLVGATPFQRSLGDIITHVDSLRVRTLEDIAAHIDGLNPGDRIKVAYVRDGQARTVEVTLGVWRPADKA